MINKKIVVSNLNYGDLQEQSSIFNDGYDLNVDGISNKTKSFVLSGKPSIINRVKLWLLSKPYDSLRENDNHIYMYDLLGKKMDSTTLSQLENSLISDFNSRSFTDITLLYIHLIPNYTKKSMSVDFVVQSKVDGTNTSGSVDIS